MIMFACKNCDKKPSHGFKKVLIVYSYSLVQSIMQMNLDHLPENILGVAVYVLSLSSSDLLYTSRELRVFSSSILSCTYLSWSSVEELDLAIICRYGRSTML